MRKLRGNLTYANVVSTLCLFLLLGGGAYAAIKLPKNSVGTKQIKNGAVTGIKIRKRTIIGTNINLAKLGTVPSAAQANTAMTATNAANATTVNGHTAECKAGTQLFAGSCWESTPRPAATQPAAAAACTGLGGSLPSASDLVSFSKVARLSAGDEWTDEINTVTAENVFTVIVVSPEGKINLDAPSDTKEYRCVLPLVG